MSAKPPEILDKMTDLVLSYRPNERKPKPRKRKSRPKPKKKTKR